MTLIFDCSFDTLEKTEYTKLSSVTLVTIGIQNQISTGLQKLCINTMLDKTDENKQSDSVN